MTSNDDIHLLSVRDPFAALGLLSRLPVPGDSDAFAARGARAVWAYPIAGLVIGGLAALAGVVFTWFDLPAAVVAGLVLTAQIILTGAMHEDGLADSADGLWGGWTRDRRLEIMKDSRIGTYGVLALGLSLILRWTALTALIGAGAWLAIPAIAAISRAVMPGLMAGLPHARDTGLSRSVGRPDKEPVMIGVALAALAGLVLTGWAVLPVLVVTGLVAAATSLIARAKIGGQTGDILGATQQLTEIAGLLTLTALLV